MNRPDVLLLAAGRGERLRPLTAVCPKPLLPFLGVPIIEYCLQRLQELRPQRVFVNGFYLADQIQEYCANLKNRVPFEVIFLPENFLLGSGGPLKKIFQGFDTEQLIVHNADLIHNIHVLHVLQSMQTDCLANLVLTNHVEGTTSVYARDDGFVLRFGEPSPSPVAQRHTFAGIYCVKREIIDRFPSIDSFGIVEVFVRILNENRDLISVYRPNSDFLWFDLGTTGGWLAAQSKILESNNFLTEIGFRQMADQLNGDYRLIPAGVEEDCGQVRLLGPVLMQNATLAGHGTVGPNVSIHNARMTLAGDHLRNATYFDCGEALPQSDCINLKDQRLFID